MGGTRKGVTQEQALELARGYGRAKKPAWTIPDLGSVTDLDEIRRRGHRLPGSCTSRMENTWVAYADPNDGFWGFRSSTVIAVSEVTGEVKYAGSAFDEG